MKASFWTVGGKIKEPLHLENVYENLYDNFNVNI